MRFGLPEDFGSVDIYTPNKSILQYPELIQQAPTNVKIPTLTEQSQEVDDDFLPSELKHAHQHRLLLTSANIQSLVTEFDRALQLQGKQVSDLISQEKTRIRLEEEERVRQETERLRRLEEDKKRKEDIERRIAKEKEEKRKAEELKQKQLEDEERRRQEEQKKKEEETKKKKEEEIKQKLEAEKKKLEEAKLKAKQGQSITDFTLIQDKYVKYKKDIADIKESIVLELDRLPDLKKQVNQLKRKINPKFGQLSHSFQQFRKIEKDLFDLISQTTGNQLAFKWILNFVAKKIVDQAETEVIVAPEASVPLAYLATALLNNIPEFEYFLTARFVKKCPFIIGYSCSIESEEGRLRMGWKRRQNKWEDEVKYDERVSGICTVWAYITTIKSINLPSYKSEDSWRFVARLLNTDPSLLTNAHFSVAANWWEAAAKAFLSEYGNQSFKLLQTLSLTWPMVVSDRKLPAAARLLIMGEDFSTGKITSFKNMEQ